MAWRLGSRSNGLATTLMLLIAGSFPLLASGAVTTPHALWEPGAPWRGLEADIAERLALVDRSNGTSVRDGVVDVSNLARDHVLDARDAFREASNASELVGALVAASFSPSTAGARSNLSAARGPSGLSEGVLALYRELGRVVTLEEEIALRGDASQVPAPASTAGALAAFAAVDALHHLRAAFRGLDADAASALEGEEDVLATLHRRMAFVPSGEDLVQTWIAPDDGGVYDAATRAALSIDRAALYRAARALAEAADEIATLPLTPSVGPRHNPLCSNSHTLVYATPDCLVIIGGATDDVYYPMAFQGADGLREANVVLVDLGGNDRYEHRAGGGVGMLQGAPILHGCSPGPLGAPPRCWAAAQLQIDLADGDDVYAPRNSGQVKLAAQGGGYLGAGLLYDAGGDDRYNVTHADLSPVHAQGAASMGVGILIDRAGQDAYEAWHKTPRAVLHAQGAATVGGLAALDDRAGDDTYAFDVTAPPSKTIDAGGAQAFASVAGVALLLDRAGDDAYRAGQDLVQGAASAGGFAFLQDDGGVNRFQLVATLGCAEKARSDCASPAPQSPIAGWSQGYADLGGFAAMVRGADRDEHLLLPYAGTAATRAHEGVALLGVGNTSGIAVSFDAAGDDVYEAVGRSLGHGEGGVGIFADHGGEDAYSCAVDSCYGAEMGGVFYDGPSDADAFGFSLDPSQPTAWVTAGGLGAHDPAASSGSGGGGGGTGRSLIFIR